MDTETKREVTTLTKCCLIRLSTGDFLGLTEYEENIYINGVKYMSQAILSTSSFENDSSLSSNNFELNGCITSDLILAEDVFAGKYDDAFIEVFLIDYTALDSDSKIALGQGYMGKFTFENDRFSTEVMGLSVKLSHPVVEIFSPNCRARFCDERCKIPVANFTRRGRVDAIVGSKSFLDNSRTESNGYYDYGVVIFLDGDNKGIKLDVRHNNGNRIELYKVFPYKVTVGEKYEIVAGCDKAFNTCKVKFNNVINFRGEPHLFNTVI